MRKCKDCKSTDLEVKRWNVRRINFQCRKCHSKFTMLFSPDKANERVKIMTDLIAESLKYIKGLEVHNQCKSSPGLTFLAYRNFNLKELREKHTITYSKYMEEFLNIKL